MNAAALRRLALLAPVALLAAAAPRQARAGGGDEDFVVYKDPSETFEIEVPTGYTEAPPTRAERVATFTYGEENWKKLRVEVNVYTVFKDFPRFAEFVLKNRTGINGPGRHEFVEGTGQKRVLSRGDGKTWVSYIGLVLQGSTAFEVHLMVHPDLYEERKEDWDRILDSFKAFELPKESYGVPAGWKPLEAAGFVLLGPVGAADPKAKDLQERRQAEIGTWVEWCWPALRTIFEDQRKFIVHMPVHMCPDEKSYRELAGDAGEGHRAAYLPAHKDRVVALDATPDGPLAFAEAVGALGVQYVSSRVGELPPWMLSGFRDYWEAAARRGNPRKGTADPVYPGALNVERLENARALFKGKYPRFADLRRMDAAAFKAAGKEAEIASWTYLYFLMHRADDRTLHAFRKVLRKSIETKDLAKAFAEEKSWTALFPKPDFQKMEIALIKWLREEKGDKPDKPAEKK